LKTARNSVKQIVITITIITLFSNCFSYIVNGQTENAFTPNDNFDIPNNNSSINFAFNGTYEKATLENNTWNFTNLQSNNNQNREKLNFTASATDSKVTISFILVYNRTFGSERVRRAILRYTNDGVGTQTFDLGLDPQKGEWGAIFNDEFIAENRGYTISTDGTITIAEAPSNITLTYYGYPASRFNQPFLNQHSVVILTTLTTIIVLIFSIIIRKRKKLHP